MQLFEFLQYDFMKNALLAVLIITPLFGILGTLIVNHRMAFFSDALGHSAFTGMAIGVLFGIGNTSVSMILFAVVFALLLNYIRHKNGWDMMGLLFHKTFLQFLQVLKTALSQNRTDPPLLVRFYRIIMSRTGNQFHIAVKTTMKLNHLFNLFTQGHICK